MNSVTACNTIQQAALTTIRANHTVVFRESEHSVSRASVWKTKNRTEVMKCTQRKPACQDENVKNKHHKTIL